MADIALEQGWWEREQGWERLRIKYEVERLDMRRAVAEWERRLEAKHRKKKLRAEKKAKMKRALRLYGTGTEVCGGSPPSSRMRFLAQEIYG